MADKKYIADGWASYRELVVPPDASDAQVTDTETAFYAGAALLWYAIMAGLDDGTEATAADLQRMDNIQSEVDAFGQKIDRELLGIVRH